jgi:hypothetical protein
MKRLLMASAISCAIAITTLAGDIPSVGAPAPQPSQTTASTNPGEIPSVGEAMSISDAALTALLTALGLASI